MTRYLRDDSGYARAPDPVKDRREQFQELNALVTRLAGWITSVPGAREITVECLPASRLPDVLADRGFDLEPLADGERILPHAVREVFALNADGTLGQVTEGSTRAVSVVIGHAGICKTRCFSFTVLV